MPTGDGLLVRLMPIGTIPLAAFTKLCAAARQHGNGIIEITGRGSIQVRGLNAASAPRFAAAIAALGIAAEDGIPVLSNALCGLDAEEILDAGALAADLRAALARADLATRLGAKISVVIDGGGALSLDGVAADVRLRAEATRGGVLLRVGVGGDGASATQLGVVAPAHAVKVAERLLEVVARRGGAVRARDVLAAEGIAVFRLAVADLLAMSARSRENDPTHLRANERRVDSIGLHRLRDGTLACGIALAFGHADAATLERSAEAAGTAGASGMRAAADRTLMMIGLTHETAAAVAAAAERLGFIVRADDPRRQVVACAGAPVCAAAEIAARAIAPRIAEIAAPLVGRAFTIHVSGCAKGCAHGAPAALTVVGTPDGCALVADGATHDVPYAVVAADELPAAIAKFVHERTREDGHA
jgi:precorrin-3B synthase